MAPSALYLLLSSPHSSEDLLKEALRAWRDQKWSVDPNEVGSEGKPLLFAVLERFQDVVDDSFLKNLLVQLRRSGLDPVVGFAGTSAIEFAVASEQWGAAMLLEAWGARLPNHTLMESRQLSRLHYAFGLAAPPPDWVEDLAHPLAGFGSIDAVVDGLPLAYHPLLGRNGPPGVMQFLVGSDNKLNDDRIKGAAERAFALYSTAVKNFPSSEFALVGWVVLGVFAYAHHSYLKQEQPKRTKAGRGLDLWDRYETLLFKYRYAGVENSFALLEKELVTQVVPGLVQMLDAPERDAQTVALGTFDNLHTLVTLRHAWLASGRSIPALQEGPGELAAAHAVLALASSWIDHCSERSWQQFRQQANPASPVFRYWSETIGLPMVDWVGALENRVAWTFLSSALVYDLVKNQGANAHTFASAFEQLPPPHEDDLAKSLATLRAVDSTWGNHVREQALSKGLPAPRAMRPKHRF